MEKKECFGAIEETTNSMGLTTVNTKPECRTCEQFRDCLRESKQAIEEKKEKNELRKQNLISQIIDTSHMISNEVGSCLLEFLNRIYNSPLGKVLFRNLLLFCEIPTETLSHSLSFSISPSTLEWIRGGSEEGETVPNPKGNGKEEVDIRIVLIQRHFPDNRKANMGLIAYEVTRLFSADQKGMKQVLQTLSPSEINQFKKMESDQRIGWLMNKWGFQEELEALRRESIVIGR